MIVHVHPDARITLDEPDTFTAFSIRAMGLDLDQILSAFAPDASAAEGEAEGDHVWLAISKLHALGAEFGSDDWRKGCDGMIAYAKTKGWIDPEGKSVRAHVER